MGNFVLRFTWQLISSTQKRKEKEVFGLARTIYSPCKTSRHKHSDFPSRIIYWCQAVENLVKMFAKTSSKYQDTLPPPPALENLSLRSIFVNLFYILSPKQSIFIKNFMKETDLSTFLSTKLSTFLYALYKLPRHRKHRCCR